MGAPEPATAGPAPAGSVLHLRADGPVAAALRQRAEVAFRDIAERSPEDLAALSPVAVQEALHELRVHQIELEMQNEDLRRAQVEVEESRSRYLELYDFAPVGYCTVNSRGLITKANLTAATLVGMNRSLLVGCPFARFIHGNDSDSWHRLFTQVINSGEPQSRELRFVKPGGTFFWIQLAAAAAQGEGGGRVCHIAFSDITREKAVAAERDLLGRKLQETQRFESLAVLAGGIAHDFNNILTAIVGNVVLARISLPANAPALAFLATIERATKRAAELCVQMSAYAGKGRFVIEPLSLSRLIAEVTSLLKISVGKNVGLRFHLQPTLPLIEADGTQLKQAVVNLVLNASEALGENPGFITVSTGVAAASEPGVPAGFSGVWLEVADTGCGMSPETQAKIFDPFFSTKFSGRGLGLSATQGIVRSHHGVIKVHSVPGAGATFRLFFPSVAVEESVAVLAPEPPAARAGPTATPGRATDCLLVVDDEEMVLDALALVLKSAGFAVVTANDGREAVDIFRTEPDRFSLVLMDLTMPRLNGHEALKELQAIRNTVRVVLMSGSSEIELRAAASGMGPAGFLLKPFETGRLIEVVREALARK